MHFSLEKALSMAISKAQDASDNAPQNGATSTDEQQCLNILCWLKQDLEPIFCRFDGGIEWVEVTIARPYISPAVYRISIKLKGGKKLKGNFFKAMQFIAHFKSMEAPGDENDPAGFWRGTSSIVLV
ncbi:MAG: hypothetical protein WEC81_01860 [Patescibacteria group bacterium]